MQIPNHNLRHDLGKRSHARNPRDCYIFSTLLKSHFSNRVLGSYNLSILSEFLKKEFRIQGGIVRFANMITLLYEASQFSQPHWFPLSR
ncbi:hypothetical protein BCON_0180g00160 [Botryotinia convoluta]|uniref:Uncharacterized protein n=1 Tax=Botryotinia convoluta TaxID=54673 RepID=A0A4Z1HVH6_9HELO|nr:hypothetical protein BCON_0180g00160 [Botryotinia convoluta]